MSSSSEEGWRQQRQPEASGRCWPAWLCEALAEAAVGQQLCARQHLHLLGERETSERVLLCTEQDRRGRPAPPTQRPTELSLGALSTPSVPPGTSLLRWV